MPRDILAPFQSEFQKHIEHLKHEITTLRTGRAHPGILESVQVEAYDVFQPLSAVASITVPDARSLIVEPWDKSILKAVETGIIKADLNLMPAVQGTQIRISLPAMTEESRKQLVKILGEKIEDARKGIRVVRDEAKAAVQAADKEGEISEDAKYKLLEQLDKTAAGMNERIKGIGEEKEAEIMTI
jgi:ribosome recycling factor